MTIDTRIKEAEFRLAMLTLTPADAALFAGQLAEIQGYSELIDEGSSSELSPIAFDSSPMDLGRPASCVLAVEIA